MALLGNYNLFNKLPLRFRGGATLADSRSNYSMSGSNRNQYAGSYPRIASTPNGYSHPYSWIMAKTAGGMSSYNQLSMNLRETILNLAGGINVEANLNGSFNITQAQLDQIANLSASITGNINATNAQLAAVSQLLANITGSMTVTSAQIGAIIDMIASLSGNISKTNAAIFATASISADLSLTTGTVTPAQIAQAVWDESSAAHLAAGSTGKALSDAGSAGNPWSAPLSGNDTAGTFGGLVQKLLTVAKFLGLK
jgi:uncharacterized protein YkvS